MHIVHCGFDTLALSIEANISQELFALLDAEKEKAEETRAPVPFAYGGADFDLLPYGGNGYRFILKGGPLDVTWFIKKPNARDKWGIRISVGSTFLATQGLDHARGDPSPVLDAGEEVLDPVALLVEFAIVARGVPAPAPGRDAGGNPLVLKGLEEPVGIIALVGQEHLGGR